MTPPVLVVGFNRPDTLRAVVDAVVAASPSRLYVALDGPRPDRPDDARACAEAQAVAASVTGQVPVERRTNATNLGCARGMKSAIDWFFENESEGIILEDDCLAHPQFFSFCEHLLQRYRDDQRVWMVTGNNLLTDYGRSYGDYFFSDGGVWGWASWRDRWSQASLAPEMDPGSRRHARQFLGRREWRRIEPRVAAAARGDLDTWDYQWLFTRASRHGLAVVPAGNLVTNVGFGSTATHTTQPSATAELPYSPVHVPPRSTAPMRPDRGYIRRKARLEEPSLRQRIRAKVGRS